MNVALDTNAYTDLAAGDLHLTQLAANSPLIVIPYIVLAELRAGFAVGTLTAKNELALASFLAKPNVHVYYADENTILHYAAIYKRLRDAGRKIPINDLWIAALVLQHDLSLATRDAHFDHLPEIKRV